MHNSFLKLIFLLFIILITGSSFQELKAQTVLQKDSSSVDIRTVNKKRVDEYKNQKEFQYETHTVRGYSAWDLFWYWVWQQYDKLMQRDGFRVGSKILFWALAIGITVFAIVKIVGMEKVMLWIKGNKSGLGEFSVSEEDIHGINFEKEISTAVVQKNFREAIRLMYLQSLKKLSDRELIHWSPSKTNIDYSRELAATAYTDHFQQLTRFYEYAWYGEFMPAEDDYKKIAGIFHHFNKKVQA